MVVHSGIQVVVVGFIDTSSIRVVVLYPRCM